MLLSFLFWGFFFDEKDLKVIPKKGNRNKECCNKSRHPEKLGQNCCKG